MNATKHSPFATGDNPDAAEITLDTPNTYPRTEITLIATHNSTTAEKTVTTHRDHIAPSERTTDAPEIRREIEKHSDELANDELRTALRILQLRAWVDDQPWLTTHPGGSEVPGEHDRSGKYRFRPSLTETVTFQWVSPAFGSGKEHTMTVHRNTSTESVRAQLINRRARHKIKTASDRARTDLKRKREEEGDEAIIRATLEILDRTPDTDTIPNTSNNTNTQTPSPRTPSSSEPVEQASLSDF